MSERFFTPLDLSAPSVEIDGPEAHHMTAVLRLKPGDDVTLFDGRGLEAAARIETAAKRRVVVAVVARRVTEPGSTPRLVLATAVPKGDRFRWLVEKATELGVDRLVPLETARSVVDPREGKLDRQRQAVVAACKQCGRNRLMEITPVLRWKDFLAAIRQDGSTESSLIVAHPGGEPWTDVASRVRSNALTILAVGPEGGFTDDEIASAQGAGAAVTSLGPFILRIETAAIALAARFAPAGSGGPA